MSENGALSDIPNTRYVASSSRAVVVRRPVVAPRGAVVTRPLIVRRTPHARRGYSAGPMMSATSGSVIPEAILSLKITTSPDRGIVSAGLIGPAHAQSGLSGHREADRYRDRPLPVHEPYYTVAVWLGLGAESTTSSQCRRPRIFRNQTARPWGGEAMDRGIDFQASNLPATVGVPQADGVIPRAGGKSAHVDPPAPQGHGLGIEDSRP